MDGAEASSRTRDEPLRRILDSVAALGLNERLMELETQGYTILRRVLAEPQIAAAKAAILARVERTSGRRVDEHGANAADFNGMRYIPYLLYDDPVFEAILTAPGPLSLITYLLGESCLLSSMGCHFRGPGGAPLMIHSDNGNGMPAPFSPIAMVANINYALTPYSREAGALAMIPGSHRLCRQPTPQENFTTPGVSAKQLAALTREGGGALDGVAWKDPPGALAMTLDPGDAVVWHGNTWHGSFRRELAGVRMNLAVYFNRQHIQTQERHDGPARQALIDRHGEDSRLAVLLGARQPYGWREEGPDYSLMARNPRGPHD
jgi:ectoine hydroxylase-related dioxygenase (phytanoyl-CoA dioxygenase family)